MVRTDLTGYAALLGESLTAKVDLLERLIGDAHYPSLGQYKERLLADTIRGFLPRTVEVGTGFVMFPHQDMNPLGGADLHDPLNQSAYSISRQCDILVYDAARYPAVFRDGDFVVLRPEAVRAVIEVKGSLSKSETMKALSSFHDFATKWRNTQIFYRDHHIPMTPAPELFIMAWRMSKDTAGRSRSSPAVIRDVISTFYADHVSPSEADGYPFLEQLLIHNEAQIIRLFELGQTGGLAFGWSSFDGQFTRVSEDGSLTRENDRTIAALLASLHWAVAEQDFNRFFSYSNEVRSHMALPYKYSGISRTWSSLCDSDSSRIMSRVPYSRERE